MRWGRQAALLWASRGRILRCTDTARTVFHPSLFFCNQGRAVICLFLYLLLKWIFWGLQHKTQRKLLSFRKDGYLWQAGPQAASMHVNTAISGLQPHGMAAVCAMQEAWLYPICLTRKFHLDCWWFCVSQCESVSWNRWNPRTTRKWEGTESWGSVFLL